VIIPKEYNGGVAYGMKLIFYQKPKFKNFMFMKHLSQ